MPIIPVIPEGQSSEELEINRLNTAAFISANPVMVILVPRTRVNDGEGTRWTELPARPAQTLRIIDQSSARGPVPGTLRSSDGIERRVEFQLLGKFDATFGVYDHWTDDNGKDWEIADLLPDNGYEKRAQVIRHGG